MLTTYWLLGKKTKLQLNGVYLQDAADSSTGNRQNLQTQLNYLNNQLQHAQQHNHKSITAGDFNAYADTQLDKFLPHITQHNDNSTTRSRLFQDFLNRSNQISTFRAHYPQTPRYTC